MNPEIFEAVNRSKLTEIHAPTDPEAVMSWVEDLLKSKSLNVSCSNYQSVFLCKDRENRENIIGATGRLLGIKVSVSSSKIVGELDYMGDVFYTTTISTAADCSSVPFHDVFTLSKSLYDRVKENLSAEFYSVPFVGGVRSICLADQLQEIVNYYLPEIELFAGEDRSYLFVASHIAANISDPKPTSTQEISRVSFTTISEEPTRSEYISTMADILQKLNEGFIKKIVFTRKRSIRPGVNFSREHYVKYLFRKYYQEYFFLFRQGEADYWAGISPEVIIKQDGRKAVTEPLAGTRKKTSETSDYEAVRRDLTGTPKDISEHDYALFHMYDQLVNGKIGHVQIDDNKTLLETPYAFHIKSKIAIDLDTSASFFDIIRAIYPPPTIWGIPVDKTEKILLESEPFKREYFTGLYGYWTFADTANIALVLRSVKIDTGSVCLYAGGGIVASSDPIAEYEEAENKMLPLMDFFNI